MFNRVSSEFAGTCCAHHTTCFSTEGGEGGGEPDWDNEKSFFVNGGLVFKRAVMLLRDFSGGDGLHLRFELHQTHFTGTRLSCEALLYTHLLKAIYF